MGLKMMIFGLLTIFDSIAIYIWLKDGMYIPVILKVIIYSILVYVSFM